MPPQDETDPREGVGGWVGGGGGEGGGGGGAGGGGGGRRRVKTPGHAASMVSDNDETVVAYRSAGQSTHKLDVWFVNGVPFNPEALVVLPPEAAADDPCTA